MPEHQNIEFKQNWHDDYLKWVCGFANAQGGVIFIGKDDNGNVVNVADYKKLMVKATSFVKEKGKITNNEYQNLNKTTERTASRDLSDLVKKQVFKSSGMKGAGAFYTLLNE